MVLRDRKDKNLRLTEAIRTVGSLEAQLKLKNVDRRFTLLLNWMW